MIYVSLCLLLLFLIILTFCLIVWIRRLYRKLEEIAFTCDMLYYGLHNFACDTMSKFDDFEKGDFGGKT